VPAKTDSAFPKSDDGLCHTLLDTILMFNKNGVNNAVVVFGTNEYEGGEIVNCHACQPMVSIAIFEKGSDNIWRLGKFIKNFCKDGFYGSMPGIGITKVGDNYFLQVSDENEGMGYSGGGSIYWHLPSLVKSITTTFEDNSYNVTQKKDRHGRRDSIQDISANGKTKVLLLKLESSFVKGKDHERVVSKQEYMLNDSCIFRPVKKQGL
jgi:hypothetical protein